LTQNADVVAPTDFWRDLLHHSKKGPARWKDLVTDLKP
jgi:hypothetical protein